MLLESAVPEHRSKLEEQIRSINKIQRHTECKEVNFYRLQKRKPAFDEATRLPFDQDEYKYCVIYFSVPDSDVVFIVDIWIVRGFLFSLTFNRSPKNFLRCDQIITEQVKRLPAATINPLCEPACGDIATSIKGLLGVDEISNVQSSANTPSFHTTESVLPCDYQDFHSLTGGFQVKSWVVHGCSSVRHIVLDAGSFFVLAEDPRSLLVVEERSETAKIFLIDTESDGQPVFVGTSFISALKSQLKDS